MNIKTQPYPEYLATIPKTGKHIIGQQSDQHIIVYQAYNTSIAQFAVQHQYFGGSHFSYNRMSWIKPNFLWMMYRCGWAGKDANQASVLAIHLSKTGFEEILKNAVYSSYQEHIYGSQEAWKQELAHKDVRLQWDPDHNPFGDKQERRAIQLGMKGELLKKYGTEFITKIEDITDFVKAQKKIVDSKDLHQLFVPCERIFLPADLALRKKLGLTIEGDS